MLWYHLVPCGFRLNTEGGCCSVDGRHGKERCNDFLFGRLISVSSVVVALLCVRQGWCRNVMRREEIALHFVCTERVGLVAGGVLMRCFWLYSRTLLLYFASSLHHLVR